MQKELFKKLVSDMEDYAHLELESDYNILGLQKMQTGFYMSISDKYFNLICNLFFDRIDFNTDDGNKAIFREDNRIICILNLKKVSPRKIKVA